MSIGAKDLKSTDILSNFRNKKEILHKQERVNGLRKLTIATFLDDSPINNEYIFILDNRFFKDRTCVLLQIPRQILETDINDVGAKYIAKQERRFHRREEYVLHRNGWIDRETGKDVGVEELKAVRIRFENMGQAYKLNAREECVGELARSTYNTNEVFMSGPEYQYPDQRLNRSRVEDLLNKKTGPFALNKSTNVRVYQSFLFTQYACRFTYLSRIIHFADWGGLFGEGNGGALVTLWSLPRPIVLLLLAFLRNCSYRVFLSWKPHISSPSRL
jgi:hypothetical protein